MTLKEARDILRELARTADGAPCPCCTQKVKIYDRPLNTTMVRSLIAFWREYGRAWGSLPDLRRKVNLHHSNQEAQLAHFGPMEDMRERREDGGHAGMWRVTAFGEDWLHDRVAVPHKARQYNARKLGLVGEPKKISDIIDGFDLREVMRPLD
jgi:hypothetical protein